MKKVAPVFACLLVLLVSCGDTDPKVNRDSEASRTTADLSALGTVVPGLRGAPIPSTAVAVQPGPSAATEIAEYRVDPDSPLSDWYDENAPSGDDLEGGWIWCQDETDLDPEFNSSDSVRIWTRPGAVGVDVLEVGALNESGSISVLYTVNGLPC